MKLQESNGQEGVLVFFDSLSLFASCVFIYSVLVASHVSTSLIDAHSASILRTSHDVASIPSISTSCSSLISFPSSFASFASPMVTFFVCFWVVSLFPDSDVLRILHIYKSPVHRGIPQHSLHSLRALDLGLSLYN